jgi:hypothetical protein
MEQPAQEEAIPRAWKVAGLGAAVAAFLLVSLAIHVSTYDVAYGTRVWGTSSMAPGGPAALRIAVRLRGQGTFAPARVSVALLEDGGEAAAGAEGLVSGPTGLVETSLRLPAELAPGDYVLEVQVETEAGPAETARFPVRIAEAGDAAPWAVLRPVCEESSSRRPEGGWHPARRCRPEPRPAWLYPAAGHLVAEVSSPVHVWIPPTSGDVDADIGASADNDASGDTDADADATAPAAIQIVPLHPTTPGNDAPTPAADPIRVPLDPLGLGVFDYAPTFPRGALLVRSERLEERIWLRDLPAPITVFAPVSIARPGERVDLRLGLRQDDRPVYVDVWTEGRWTQATSGYVRGDRGELTLEIPEAARGLMWVRVAAHPDGAGAATRALWIAPEGPSGEALGALATRLSALPRARPLAAYAGGGPEDEPLVGFIISLPEDRLRALSAAQVNAAAAAMLSRIEPAESAPPLLGDTTGEKLLALDAWKAGVRRPLMASLGLLAASVLFGGTFLVVSYQRRVRARLAALDLDADPDVDGPPPGSITGGWIAPAAMLLIVVASGVAAIFVFIETLRWDRGDVFAARAREAAERQVTPRRGRPPGRRSPRAATGGSPSPASSGNRRSGARRSRGPRR